MERLRDRLISEGEIRDSIGGTCEIYKVDPRGIKQRVIDTALGIVEGNKSLKRRTFLSDHERVLFFLSYVSSGVDRAESARFTTTSQPHEESSAIYERIRPSSRHTENVATEYFVPHSVSVEETEVQTRGFNSWDNGSLLEATRVEFSVTPENEVPFDLVVTELDEDGFRKEYEAAAFVSFRTKSGEPLICLPKEPKKNTLIHEYIHTQFGFLLHKYGDLGRGIEEGIVEGSTPHPESYRKQVELYRYLKLCLPGLDVSIKRSRNNPSERIEIFGRVVNYFGLNGLSYILRISPDEARSSMRFYETDMYDYVLDPVEVFHELENIRRRQMLQ